MFVSFLNVQYTPPVLSSLHISFMCSQSISTLIKKVSTFNNAQSILLDSYVLLDLYSRWFPICFQPRECACSRACSSYKDFTTYSQSNSNFFELPVQQYTWGTDNICTPSFHLYRAYVEERDVKKEGEYALCKLHVIYYYSNIWSKLASKKTLGPVQ